MKKAIVVGHTGQDGTFLVQLLQKKAYEIIGLSGTGAVRNSTSFPPVDITDHAQVFELVRLEQPDEIYHLAAIHHSSSDEPVEDGSLFRKSIEINFMSLIHFLEGIRIHSRKTKLFYAGSSHVFGNPTETIQDEQTAMRPNCIYGISKTSGIQACSFYRDTYSTFASTGILYNHESPVRASKFVSKKIVETAVRIKHSKTNQLALGNLNSKIDWGYAPDYTAAMHHILQLEKPGDYVISSGELHTIGEFTEGVFNYLGLDWKKYVTEDQNLIKKKPKENLFGDNRKLLSTGWKPETTFDGLIKIMVDAELKKHG